MCKWFPKFYCSKFIQLEKISVKSTVNRNQLLIENIGNFTSICSHQSDETNLGRPKLLQSYISSQQGANENG